MRRTSITGVLVIAFLVGIMLTPMQAQAPVGNTQVIQASRNVPAEPSLGLPRDGTKLPEVVQPIFYSAHRGMDWLKLANKPDGRFVYGFIPALRMPLEGDNFLSQAGATYALARATRYFRDERGGAVARQAALTLFMETDVDPKDATIRFTLAPPQVLNRLASHGLLVLAVHELASPGKDLLEQADQLCNYLRKQQQSDGTLLTREGLDGPKRLLSEAEVQYAGIALYAVARSHKKSPAPWKIDMLKKALAGYQGHWQSNKDLATAVSLTPAFAEAYLLTKEPAFAEMVFTMNDWLVGMQYGEDQNSSRKHWYGGFHRSPDGKVETTAPDVWSALPAESLAEACRAAKQAGDLPRLRRYERALVLALHFVMSLQYSGAKVQHFVDGYRPLILGAFHASFQDGNLRLDYTQHPLCAMVQYLDAVIE